MSSITHRRCARTLAIVCTASLLALLATLATARTALARSYSMDSVNIDATVAPSGTLSVTEVREFDFDGSFHGVYWNIPTGTYQGRTIDTTIESVGEIVDGTFVAFEESDSGANHTYQLTSHSNYIEVKVYTAHEDESALVSVSYTDAHLATRYDDVAELYWKFVSDGWEGETQNVTCTIKLPVPEGATVEAGENVRAWGHGPLDANVEFRGNDIVYTVPGVGTDEYAEARVTFPSEWLSEAEPTGTSALSSILSEEQRWADEANERRRSARILIYGGMAIGAGVCALALLAGILTRRRYRASHRPRFTDEYFRDVPTDDHPAVLGALYHGGRASGAELTASLMRLTDMGNISLELVKFKKRGVFGREKEVEDYRLSKLDRPIEGSGGTSGYDIDVKTMDFIFRSLLPRARHKGGQPDDGSFYFSEMEDIARHNPERYDDAYKGWQAKVEAAGIQRKFYSDDHKVSKAPAIAAGVVCLVVGVAISILLFAADAIWQAILLFVAAFASAITAFALASSSESLSDEAIDLKAQLDALRRWLKDFTRLDEAVPNDVVLWNRLLVMATVLGVAKEVIDQLKVAAPEMLESSYMAPVYGWYLYGDRMPNPAKAFESAAASAHSVSAAKLADSSDSSGGGGGGGFSGGGGGGFGGGGGGGAF